MSTVFVHKYAGIVNSNSLRHVSSYYFHLGILSAYGMALADVVQEAQEPSAKIYCEENFPYFDQRLSELQENCRQSLKKQGFSDNHIFLEPYLHMRYDGTDCALMCGPSEAKGVAPKNGDFLKTFVERYKSEFGFVIQQRNVIVDDIRVRGVGKSDLHQENKIKVSNEPPKPVSNTRVFFEGGYQATNVYLLKDLFAQQVLKGPAIIMDQLSTILIEPDCTGVITNYGDIKITIGTGKLQPIGPELDSIQLSIFSHRFMSIAEQMGRYMEFFQSTIYIKLKHSKRNATSVIGPCQFLKIYPTFH